MSGFDINILLYFQNISLPADSNTSRKSFDTVEQADFQIYILRFPSAKHSDEPLKAGIVFSKGFHDS